MMAATQRSGQEAIVTLSSADSSEFPYPVRHISLCKENPTANIGRTSKRNDSFGATVNNGWIDSAVMSRDHAQLKLDLESWDVLIQDIGSTHGTFCNKNRVYQKHPQKLKDGDLLEFGVAIERGVDRFLPCIMKVAIQFGPDKSENRPAVFRVPDDTDVEDLSSEDDADVQYSSQILRQNNIRPAKPGASAATTAIDVESEEQHLPSSDAAYKSPTSEPVVVDLTFSSLMDVQADGTSLGKESLLSGDATGKEGQKELESLELDFEQSSQQDISEAEDHLSNSANWNDDSSAMSSSSPMAPLPLSEDGSRQNFDPNYSDEDELAEHNEPHYLPESLEFLGDAPDSNIDGSKSPLEGDEECHGEATSIQDAHFESPAKTFTPQAAAGWQQFHKQPEVLNSGQSVVDNVELPPITEDHPKYISLFDSCQFDPVNRLPPIKDALPLPPSSSQNSQLGNRSFADILGTKTGKYEFFAAREQNKLNAHNQPQSPAKGSSAPQLELPATNLLASEITSLLPRLGKEKSSPSTTTDMNKTTANPEKTKGASNMQTQTAHDPKRPLMGIGDIINRHCEKSQTTPKSLKRKATEISQATRGNELVDAARDVSSQMTKSTVSESVAPLSAASTSLPDGTPPRKRLRRFAEAFGYATLGGVAVISALVATAPSL